VRSRGAYVHTAVNRDVGYLCVRERCDPSCKGRIPHAYVRAPRMGVTLTTDIHSVYQNPESVGAESEQRTEEAALAFHSRFLKIGHIFQPKYETCLRLLWLHWSWVPSAEKDVGAKGGGARRAEEEGGGGGSKERGSDIAACMYYTYGYEDGSGEPNRREYDRKLEIWPDGGLEGVS